MQASEPAGEILSERSESKDLWQKYLFFFNQELLAARADRPSPLNCEPTRNTRIVESRLAVRLFASITSVEFMLIRVNSRLTKLYCIRFQQRIHFVVSAWIIHAADGRSSLQQRFH